MCDLIYSPIVIVTLNRIEHLKRCISSLKANTGADKTDLYIAVDYPPSNKYVDGYNQVCEFLEKPIDGFRRVHIVYRNVNYGPIVNLMDICKQVLKEYDRIIILEDDNELAPCFLDFCNRGLEQYRNDKSIVGLNASSYVWCGEGMKARSSNIQGVRKRQLLFHAFATWKDDFNSVMQWCDSQKILNDGMRIDMLLKLRCKSRCFFYSFVENVLCNRKRLPWIKGKIYPIDQVWDYYMMLYDKYMVCPKISLTRDWGCDGTGAHYTEVFSNMNQLLGIKLDNNVYFEGLANQDIEVDRYEIYQHDIHTYNRPKSLLHAWKACLSIWRGIG